MKYFRKRVATRQNQQHDKGALRRLRSAWASVQSDQNLRLFSMGSKEPKVSSGGQRRRQMPRLIWVFAGARQFVGFVMRWLKYECPKQIKYFRNCTSTTHEPHHDKTNNMACAPSEDSDQPGHPPSVNRVFAVRMKKALVLNYPLSAQRKFRFNWADIQADLSLR